MENGTLDVQEENGHNFFSLGTGPDKTLKLEEEKEEEREKIEDTTELITFQDWRMKGV
jgi:hypothetical protein